MSLPGTLKSVTIRYAAGNDVHVQTFNNPEQLHEGQHYITVHVNGSLTEMFVTRNVLKVTKVYAQ